MGLADGISHKEGPVNNCLCCSSKRNTDKRGCFEKDKKDLTLSCVKVSWFGCQIALSIVQNTSKSYQNSA